MWPVCAQAAPAAFMSLSQCLGKHLWSMGKKSSSGGIVRFCGLSFPGKWTDGVRECDIGVPTTTRLKTAASCCFITVFVTETVMYPRGFRSLTDRRRHTWQWSCKVVTAENVLSPSDA